MRILGKAAAVPLLTVVLAIVGPPPSRTDELAGYWQGRLEAGELSWELGLAIEGEGQSRTALLDLPSLWRGPTPAERFESRGRALAFDLPWEMGRVEARAEDGRIVGSATLENGLTGELALERSSRPEIRRVEGRVMSGGEPIALTLALPEGQGPHPAVVVVPGGGDSDRASPPIRFWADWLPRRGIACLIYDKRGNGESGGDWRQVGFDVRAADLEALIDYARRRDEIDAGAVGLPAVSQGTWLAVRAGAHDPTLRFIVQISGPVGSVLEADTRAVRKSAIAAGLGAEEIEEYLELWRLEVDAVRAAGSADRWRALTGALEEAEKRPWWKKRPHSATNPDHWWTKWYGRVSSEDSLERLPGVAAPMLWLYGAVDTQLDTKTSVARLEALRVEHDRPWTIRVFERAGHSLLIPVDERGRPQAPLTIAPGFFEALTDFLDRVLEAPPVQISRRPASERARVTSSVYSMSPPTGMPKASRVTRTPSGLSSRAR